MVCGCGLFGQNKILFFAGQSFALRDLLLLVYSSYLQPLSTTAGITSTLFVLRLNVRKKKRAGDTLSDSTLLAKWILFIA